MWSLELSFPGSSSSFELKYGVLFRNGFLDLRMLVHKIFDKMNFTSLEMKDFVSLDYVTNFVSLQTN